MCGWVWVNIGYRHLDDSSVTSRRSSVLEHQIVRKKARCDFGMSMDVWRGIRGYGGLGAELCLVERRLEHKMGPNTTT